MLAQFLIHLLMLCAALIVTGWTIDTASRAAGRQASAAEPDPCADDSWFSHRFLP